MSFNTGAVKDQSSVLFFPAHIVVHSLQPLQALRGNID